MEYLKPKTGLLPKHVPEDEWLVMEDVHKGPFAIWVGMKGTVFVDVDGTVADLAHRRVYVASKPKNYPAFERGIPDDTPIQWVIDAVARLYDAGWTVVMCTGRRETQKAATEKWLADHGVKYHAFYIRPEFERDLDGSVKISKKGNPKPDYRHDYIIKAELLAQARADGYDPDVVFDDRDQVVTMWRENGIPVVQTAEGDF
jgi:hypothetical protein